MHLRYGAGFSQWMHLCHCSARTLRFFKDIWLQQPLRHPLEEHLQNRGRRDFGGGGLQLYPQLLEKPGTAKGMNCQSGKKNGGKVGNALRFSGYFSRKNAEIECFLAVCGIMEKRYQKIKW